jgi:hypothetical protein
VVRGPSGPRLVFRLQVEILGADVDRAGPVFRRVGVSRSLSISCSFQESNSISVMEPSKYCTSMVSSASSIATTSNNSFVAPRYH